MSDILNRLVKNPPHQRMRKPVPGILNVRLSLFPDDRLESREKNQNSEVVQVFQAGFRVGDVVA